jgi:hypothetical protein
MICSWSSAIVVTDIGDGRAHPRAASESQPLTGVRQVSVLCGRLISPAPLVAPEGRTCASCVAAARATNAQASSEPPSLHGYLRIAARVWRGCRAAAGAER